MSGLSVQQSGASRLLWDMGAATGHATQAFGYPFRPWTHPVGQDTGE